MERGGTRTRTREGKLTRKPCMVLTETFTTQQDPYSFPHNSGHLPRRGSVSTAAALVQMRLYSMQRCSKFHISYSSSELR
jgi:hypothetical protein